MLTAAVQTADWGDQRCWNWRGWRCHWRVAGPLDGPAILLLHGFGAASGHWRHCAPALAHRGWRVYSLDLLGFGASDQPARPLDNRIWALQVKAFLNQVVNGPAVLLGNSLGGLTALTTAVLAPGWVRAVIAAPLPDPALVQPLPQRRAPWRRRWQRRLLKLVLHLLPLELIVPLIAVHLFVFYFGIMADVTPPVGLASFAAAAVSKGDPIKTGVTAFYYSLRTAALPFLFIFNTDLLLIDQSDRSLRISDQIWAFSFGGVGMIKRLRPRPDGSIAILSDNPNVPEDRAVDDELFLIGRVVAKVSKL